MEPVYTPRGLREKKLQKSLLLYWDAKQQPLAREALLEAGRGDLIGRAPHCLSRKFNWLARKLTIANPLRGSAVAGRTFPNVPLTCKP